MSKHEAKKTEQMVFRTTKEMAKKVKALKINMAETCREALRNEIEKEREVKKIMEKINK